MLGTIQIKLMPVLMSIMKLFSSGREIPQGAASYGVFIGAQEDKLLSLKNYDVLVVDAEKLGSDDIASMHKNGNEMIYSYLNIGSVESFRSYYDEFLPYTIGDYENWEDERWVDVSSEQWQAHIAEAADDLMCKGIDGIFADNADVYYIYHDPETYNALIKIFSIFSEKGLSVILNGGDVFISEAIRNNAVPECIKAVDQECVFTSVDFRNKTFGENAPEVRKYFLDYLDECARNGIGVYFIEYGADGGLKKEIQYYCMGKGFGCYFADSVELN